MRGAAKPGRALSWIECVHRRSDGVALVAGITAGRASCALIEPVDHSVWEIDVHEMHVRQEAEQGLFQRPDELRLAEERHQVGQRDEFFAFLARVLMVALAAQSEQSQQLDAIVERRGHF